MSITYPKSEELEFREDKNISKLSNKEKKSGCTFSSIKTENKIKRKNYNQFIQSPQKTIFLI